MTETTRRRRVDAGTPYPLGATLNRDSTNFALFTAHATKVELCLFDADGTTETERIALPEYTDQVYHGAIEGLRAGQLYGYRVHGPYAPEAGHRFNPNKLLLDPYARAHVGEIVHDPAIFGYQLETGDDLTFDERDSAPFVPKCVLVAQPEAPIEPGPRHPWSHCILYETHVRGYTKRHPGVAEDKRGTYAGLATPAVIEHIKALGVTAVELLPVHRFVNDQFLVDKGLNNFWGYNTIAFFAPHPHYAADPGRCIEEFRAMVAAYHAAGLEVVLDVVFNHTAEGNEKGPTLSFKGIDNASYYQLIPDQKRHYINDTGTGNTFDVSHPRVTQLVLECLRYWVQEIGVDGFRFDLAATLGRRPPNGFDRNSAFLNGALFDPVLRQVRMIAEPWDIGPGGYQVGNFPPGWAEWNDKFRDEVRDFWRGAAPVTTITSRLCASGESFNHEGRRPWSSVNLITAHDGFTLRDVVTYNEKHNDANQEGNQDGSSDNRSWNCGLEGPTDNRNIKTLRAKQMRNFMATLLLAQGTPMIVAGDEFGRTQQGNNNAYCQDNEISWVDWDFGDDGKTLLAFTQKLGALRHKYPVLRRNRYYTGAVDETVGIKDLTWIKSDGLEVEPPDWTDAAMRCVGMLMDGEAFLNPVPQDGDHATLLLLVNAARDAIAFSMPEYRNGVAWRRLIDTSDANRPEKDFDIGDICPVPSRAMVLLRLKTTEPETAEAAADQANGASA